MSWWCGDPAHRDRVRAAPLPDAQPEAGAQQGTDPGPGLELRLRRPGQRRGALHLLPAQEGRRRSPPDDPHHARRGLRAQAGRPVRNAFASLTSRLVLTVVALVVLVAVLIGVAATAALAGRLTHQLDDALRAAAGIHSPDGEGAGPADGPPPDTDR